MLFSASLTIFANTTTDGYIPVLPRGAVQSIQLGCLGYQQSDLIWSVTTTSGEMILLEGDTTVGNLIPLVLGDNIISLSIDNSIAIFDGLVVCRSRTSLQQISISVSACVERSEREIPGNPHAIESCKNGQWITVSLLRT